ncbi:MAG: NAD-dependent epimerase/dehydratase family protein [Clostridia bacterium]|nr:NAD-dependent epimerase/dehydratase family protein [Clostridia bacterium]
MKALLIGGTGVISSSVVKRLLSTGWEVTLLNRGNRAVPEGVRVWQADINDTARVQELLAGERFDTVADFIVFTPEQARRDMALFSEKTDQYIFISSASAYQKPVPILPITEDMPLVNPYWEYSRNKAAIEDLLMAAYREQGFPVTVVRPSHTYCERSLPVQIHGAFGPWQVLRRMMDGKTVPVAADGETLWTMTWAEDFAVYFCGLCGNAEALRQAYHITSDESITWNEVYRVIAEHLHVEYKPCYIPAHLLAQVKQYDFRGQLLGDKANSVIFDNSKVMCATGIPPIRFLSYREGAGRSIAYFLSHTELQRADPDFDAFCDRAEAAMAAARQSLLEV